ncbi:MAG: extracellular solute-binding protein [Alphaproteobacteria bacterium]|nr:extracellular solute-binding protein [Alphaproteobacteria bacterium]MCB9929701.1 extracellular solute-binding protein [Alphaproteobacteria bacterium]
MKSQSNKPSRRQFLGTTAAVSAAALAAPYVKRAYAAGSLSVGLWDHWVPGANDATRSLIAEWSKKENVEVKLDYITSQGGKIRLTWAAESQAQSGHDVMAFSSWYPAQYANSLHGVNDLVEDLIKENGQVNGTVEYLGKVGGKWLGVPATVGSQMKGPCSRIDLLKKYGGIDIQKIYPAGAEPQDKDWNLDVFMKLAEACHAGGNPIGIGLGVTSDSVDSVGAFFHAFGAKLVDEKGDITVNTPEVRAALEYMVKLGPLLAPDAPAWDDSSNNKWLVSGNGSMIMNPPSAWAVAKRDAPEIAEQLWTHGFPSGPKGRFGPFLPFFWGIWEFSEQKEAAKSLLRYLSSKEAAYRMVDASGGYDIPAFANFTSFDIWGKVEPPKGTLFHYPDPYHHQTLSIAAAPAPHAIAAQIFAQGTMPKMVVRLMQGEDIERTIKWAESECEGYMRT